MPVIKNKKKSDPKSVFRKKLLIELNRSLIVDEKTREYWMKNYQTLPITAVTFFYEYLLKANQQIDKYIAAGLESSPELVEQITLKSKAAKKKLLKFQEHDSQDEENPEEFLKENLK